jgi:hypothetical protein
MSYDILLFGSILLLIIVISRHWQPSERHIMQSAVQTTTLDKVTDTLSEGKLLRQTQVYQDGRPS